MGRVVTTGKLSAGKYPAGTYPIVWPNVWRSVVAGAAGIGFVLGAGSPTQAESCEVRVTDLVQRAGVSVHERETSALAQAELLFSRVSVVEIDAQLQGSRTGDVREVTELFQGSDARWRFVRTLEGTSDPDGFVVAAQQTRWLIRPAEGSSVIALLLAGFPDPAAHDAVAQPVLVGLHIVDGAPHIFTVEPVNPTQCTWRAGQVTEWIDGILNR